MADPAAERGVIDVEGGFARMAYAGFQSRQVVEPAYEGLGPVKPEDRATSRVGIETVGEMRLDAGAPVAERERADAGRQMRGKPLAVLGRLDFDTGESRPLLFRLDDTGSPPVHVEEVIGEAVARLEREVAEGHATGRMDVRLDGVLHGPPGVREHPVYLFAGLVFRLLCHPGELLP